MRAGKNAVIQRPFALVQKQRCCPNVGSYAENGRVLSQKGIDMLKLE